MKDLDGLRRLLGWLLLWALLPLPFLYIVLPPFWLAAGAAGVGLVLRPDRRFSLSRTALNVVGVVILVLVLIAGGLHVGPLRPLGHMLLLLTAVSVLLVDDRTSFMRALGMVGMVWVVSVTASTHMTASAYFIASAVIGWWVGMRLHLMVLGLPLDDPTGTLPRARHVLLAAGAALVIAVPFFLIMPRLGSPWVAGRSFSRTTGFSPSVDLGTMGRLTESQDVALIMRSPNGDEILEAWTRLRGTAFDQVMAGAFLPRRTELRELEPRRGVIWLRDEVEDLADTVEIEIDLLRPRRYLMLPPGAVAIQVDTSLAMDLYGGVLFGYRRGEPLSYRVWVGDPAPPRALPPSDRDIRLPNANAEVRELALSVTGSFEGAEARATAVERFLQQNFGYTLEPGVRMQHDDPVAWFLLEGGAGHCEFFAGSMVVMLRHLEIPARMVAGYSGGDVAPDLDEVVVREANAHAWVEVWLGDDRGWVLFDPTPPASVPQLGGASGLDRIRWAWQQLELLWDRRLLTFGLGEQIDLIDGLSAAMARARGLVRRPIVLIWIAAAVALIAVAVPGWLWWRRWIRPWRSTSKPSRGPASRAVIRLARALIPVGGIVPPSATVRSIGSQAVDFWPQAQVQIGELVRRAEDELYGDHGPTTGDAAEVKRLWKSIRSRMKNREIEIEG